MTGKEGKRIVDRLKCKVCLKYKSRIESRKIYSDKWLVDAESVRISNIRDHACSDQHLYAMSLHYKEPTGYVANAGEPSNSNICMMLYRLSEDSKDRHTGLHLGNDSRGDKIRFYESEGVMV